MGKDKKDSNATVIRVHKTKNYTVMSNNHLFDKPPLSLKAKGLMSLFLALPDDWNYSIEGLAAISKESRDCIKSTLNELKNFGYLKIEKQNGEHGHFNYIYHIFEGRENKISPEVENPSMEKPSTEVPEVDEPSTEKPTQLNTNNQNTKELNTNNGSLVKTKSVFTSADLFNLYKNICISFPKPRELTEDRRQKAEKRLKKQPTREYWETVFNKATVSNFCKNGTWFNFDWILKNDGNALKVYEGNYDNKGTSLNIHTKQPIAPVNLSKYANYHKKQAEGVINA